MKRTIYFQTVKNSNLDISTILLRIKNLLYYYNYHLNKNKYLLSGLNAIYRVYCFLKNIVLKFIYIKPNIDKNHRFTISHRIHNKTSFN